MKYTTKLSALLLSLVMLSSCGSGALVDVTLPKPPGDFAGSEERSSWRAETQVAEELSSSLDAFAAKTGEIILAGEGNVNYSPLSLYLALALSAQGASGETQAELLELLEFDGTLANAEDVADGKLTPAGYLADQCHRLYKRLYCDDRYSKLKIANSVWSKVGILPDFAKTAAESFYTESFDSLDPKAISSWIKDKTESTLAPEIEVGELELLKLINTVYFASEWSDRFQKSKTEKADFHAPDGDVKVDFMNSKAMSSFSKGEGFTRAGLGLKNGSMIFVLPDEGEDIRELIARLGLSELTDGGEHYYGDVTWSVPKFAFDYKISLKDTLSSLGATGIFEIDADFSALADTSPLFIGNIVQGTHIAIDEKGVTASAYTEIMYCGSAMPSGSAEMILDRPFLYLIEVKGETIFMGIVENPQS